MVPESESDAGPPNPSAGPGDTGFERRCRVTLLFADLCDYTALAEASDPEEIAGVRQRLMQLAKEVVKKHKGEINQFVGDGILAVFGFPEADEEDGRHALTAALELRDRACALDGGGALPAGFNLRMHSGIHSGLVFATKGDPRDGQFQFTGDAVNTASRLCGAAGRDEVIVSESTLLGLEPFFDIEPVASLQLKGKRQPVRAFRVLRTLDVETRFQARSRLGLTPFVGRHAELRSLEAALSDVCNGKGGLKCILADPGVGKTRLLDEFRKQAGRAGVRVYRGSCESYGGITPLRPFLQILREFLPVPEGASLEQRILSVERGLETLDGSLREHLPAFLQLLSIKPWNARADTDSLQLATISAVTALLLAVADTSPLVVVLDDWQWCDGASLRVLGNLVRAQRSKPLLIVIGARSISPDDPVSMHASLLQLQPFSEAESMQAARYLVEGPEQSLRSVHHRSGGNALFLEELCTNLRARAELLDDPALAGVPTTVHALIRSRVESLDTQASNVLAVAAVIGNEFPEWLLLEIASEPQALASLLGSGLLQATETGWIRFKHGLTREVVYETVRVAERRVIHRKVGQAIERQFEKDGLGDHYEALATHYAGALEHLRASEFAELAGDKAAATSALDGARTHYSAALAQIDELPRTDELIRRWLSIVTKWSAACVYYPTREQLTVLGRAVRYAQELDDYSQLALAELWTGWIQYGLGEQRAAIRHLTRSLELSQRANNDRLTAQLFANIGQCHAAAGDYGPALEYLDRGIDMKRGWLPLGAGAAYALGVRGVIHGDRGEFSAAALQLREALAIVQDRGAPLEGSLYGLLGLTQIWQGAWQEALHTAARGRATGERVNGPYVLAMCEAVSGYARWRLERTPAALDSMLHAVDWLERRDIHLYLSFCYGHLARAELEAGNADLAREYSRRALQRAENGDPLGEAEAQRVLAQLAAREGGRDEALEHVRQAFTSGERRSSEREAAVTSLVLGELLASWDQRAEARERIEGARATFDKLLMTWHAAEAARLLRGI